MHKASELTPIKRSALSQQKQRKILSPPQMQLVRQIDGRTSLGALSAVLGRPLRPMLKHIEHMVELGVIDLTLAPNPAPLTQQHWKHILFPDQYPPPSNTPAPSSKASTPTPPSQEADVPPLQAPLAPSIQAPRTPPALSKEPTPPLSVPPAPSDDAHLVSAPSTHTASSGGFTVPNTRYDIYSSKPSSPGVTHAEDTGPSAVLTEPPLVHHSSSGGFVAPRSTNRLPALSFDMEELLPPEEPDFVHPSKHTQQVTSQPQRWSPAPTPSAVHTTTQSQQAFSSASLTQAPSFSNLPYTLPSHKTLSDVAPLSPQALAQTGDYLGSDPFDPSEQSIRVATYPPTTYPPTAQHPLLHGDTHQEDAAAFLQEERTPPYPFARLPSGDRQKHIPLRVAQAESQNLAKKIRKHPPTQVLFQREPSQREVERIIAGLDQFRSEQPHEK